MKKTWDINPRPERRGRLSCNETLSRFPTPPTTSNNEETKPFARLCFSRAAGELQQQQQQQQRWRQ
jgi:hypothetical protein